MDNTATTFTMPPSYLAVFGIPLSEFITALLVILLGALMAVIFREVLTHSGNRPLPPWQRRRRRRFHRHDDNHRNNDLIGRG